MAEEEEMEVMSKEEIEKVIEEIKGMETAPPPIERDAMNRPIVLDGCVRGTPAEKRRIADLLYPEEAHMKDEAELLLEPGEWKKGDMFFEYRVKEGEELKTKGNSCFSAGDYSQAAVWYRKGLYYTVFEESQFNFELQEEHRESVVQVMVPLRLNYALCILKDEYKPLKRPLPSLEDRFNEAIENCTEVINLYKQQEVKLSNAQKSKAFYRRGLAKSLKGNYDSAREDLTEALKLEPSNKEIRSQIELVKSKDKEEREKAKQAWAGKFTHNQGILTEEERGPPSKAEQAAANAAADPREAKAAAMKAQIQEMLDAGETGQENDAKPGFFGRIGNWFGRVTGWGSGTNTEPAETSEAST